MAPTTNQPAPTPATPAPAPRRQRPTEEALRARAAVIANRENIVIQYSSGETIAALAREHHVTAPWLRRRLIAWDITLRDRAGWIHTRGTGWPAWVTDPNTDHTPRPTATATDPPRTRPNAK